MFVIEANPRASRTVPFVSKATGVPLAKVAARVMAGATLAELRAEGLLKAPVTGYVSVKEAVLPFDRFPDADSLLGPGDALDGRGHGHRRHLRAGLRQEPARRGGQPGRRGHGVLLRGRPRQARRPGGGASASWKPDFSIAATSGTAAYLQQAGVPVATVVAKVAATAIDRRTTPTTTRRRGPGGAGAGGGRGGADPFGPGATGGQHPRGAAPGRRRLHPPGRPASTRSRCSLRWPRRGRRRRCPGAGQAALHGQVAPRTPLRALADRLTG